MSECERCKVNNAEFMCLIEDDENPNNTKSIALCEPCMKNFQVIEQWTKAEWAALVSE